MNTERAAYEIKRAYGVLAAEAGDLVSITRLVAMVDLNREQLVDAITHLYRNDDRFNAVPESNQKMLTAEDWDNAVHLGCQAKHLICWF